MEELKKKLDNNNLNLDNKKIISLINKLKIRLQNISEVNNQNKNFEITNDFSLETFLLKLTDKNYGYVTYNTKNDNFELCIKKKIKKCSIKKLSFENKVKLLEQSYIENNIDYFFFGDLRIQNPDLILKKKFINFKKIFDKDFKIYSNNSEQ